MADAGGPDRRAFLAKAAATVGIAALAGCGGIFEGEGPERPPESPTDEAPPETSGSPTTPSPFDGRIDLTEYGADPSGAEPIGDAIESAVTDGQLLYLPPGEYRVDREIQITGLDRFGIVGEDATIVPGDSLGSTLILLRTGRGGALHLENLRFDFTADGTSVRAIDARAPDGLVLRDVSVAGTLQGGRGPVRVDVTDPDGTGLVERLDLPDGSVSGTRVTGCYVGDENQGNITFRDCRIEAFSDNGLYADPTAGRMTVEGGYYANSGISNVRVRAGSVVRNVHVRCDDSSHDFDNMRGIRLTNYRPKPEAAPAIVENCRIEMMEVSYSEGGILLTSDLPAARVRNTTVRIDADRVQGIWAKSPHDELDIEDSNIRLDCENVTITGDSNGGTAIQIDGRDGSVLDGLDVTQTAADRDGISLQRSTENVLRDSVLNVGGDPIVLREATLETIDVNVGPDLIERETLKSEDE
ncbi:hypothetical protein [Halobellus sp. GM3]|uniref:hypothetical protein n=1 Tax=Halobellus sp. GM3 TaxID=3458410 RepID=UPI00403D6602